MKSIVTSIIFTLMLHGFAQHASAHVYLDYPLGGESFDANTIVTLQWHIAIPHNQLNWDLFFSSDGGNTWQPIQLDLPVSQLTYTWVVPSISTSQARISVIQDNTEMDYQDETMNFTIVPMPLTPFIDITAQNLNLECNTNNQATLIQDWLNTHGDATAVGFCDDLVWTHDYSGITNDCGSTGNAFVIFTVADSCGSASTGAYLTVFDLSTPVIETSATDMMVECGNPNNTLLLNDWLANHGGAIANDACSNVTWTYQAFAPGDDCGATGSTMVIFTVTDNCGNSNSTSAAFAIEDTRAPNIQITAQDYAIECSTPDQSTILQNWLNNNGGASAMDDCGNVNWTNNYSALNDDCGTTGNALVTFTATDDCGNNTYTTANFSIVDNVAPVINTPARDTLINCAESNALMVIHNWLLNHGGATASDDCGPVLWTHDFPALADTCIGLGFGIYSVKFTAIDACNNSDTTSAIITIGTTTGTEILNTGFDFVISPNPVNDVLKVTFENHSSPINIFLFNSQGKLASSHKENASEFFIPVHEYVGGIYFLQVETSQGTFIRKVIIN